MEEERKGLRGCKEKAKKRSAMMCLTLVLKIKEGNNASNVQISKRKEETGMLISVKNLRESEEDWAKALEDWENFKSKK